MRTLFLAGALAFAFLAASAAGAAALKVYPVRMVLDPAQPIETMRIENAGDTPSRVQLRIYAWSQADGEDVLTETRDILANPTLFEAAPGKAQIVRFGLRTEPGQSEKSYRVLLEEVPGRRLSRPGGVETLLRISIPIFVPATDDAKQGGDGLRWQAVPAGSGGIALHVRNGGKVHVQVNRLSLSRQGREIGRKDLSLYVLPGASQRIALDTGGIIRPGETLRLQAETDRGKLSADIVAEAAPHEVQGR